MRCLLVLAIVGCYNPTFKPGIPCSANRSCPSGQTCSIDNTCELPGGDELAPDAAIAVGADAATDALPAARVSPRLVSGDSHTCLIRSGGALRCWGLNDNGQLGYGHMRNLGDDEAPRTAGDIVIGALVVEVAVGHHHTCVRFASGAVRCWGLGSLGRLGYSNTATIGDDETPATVGDVSLGGIAVDLATGQEHTCAVLDTGAVRCWGQAYFGSLGYGNQNNIGDDETPASAGDVPLGGGKAVEVTAGQFHTCVRLDTGRVRCWGIGDYGALGLGNANRIGDNEPASAAGDVDVGGIAVEIAAGANHTCARLDTGALRCWGRNTDGELGYASTATIGDDESPSSAGPVVLGDAAVQISTGKHTCARLPAGTVRCWGLSFAGKLGYGNTVTIGDDETPASAGDVSIGGAAVEISAGGYQTCALLESDTVRCWGLAYLGRIGYGNANDIGDNELPEVAGDVPIE